MAESQTLAVLQRKRDEIERIIANYEKQIEVARRDLVHVNATLRLFEAPEGRTEFPAYVDTLRLFRHGELAALCIQALVQEGPLDTRELTLRVMRAKSLDESDGVLRVSIARRLTQSIRLQWKEGKVTSPGMQGKVRLWQVA